jgi:hypothetical protein
LTDMDVPEPRHPGTESVVGTLPLSFPSRISSRSDTSPAGSPTATPLRSGRR